MDSQDLANWLAGILGSGLVLSMVLDIVHDICEQDPKNEKEVRQLIKSNEKMKNMQDHLKTGEKEVIDESDHQHFDYLNAISSGVRTMTIGVTMMLSSTVPFALAGNILLGSVSKYLLLNKWT